MAFLGQCAPLVGRSARLSGVAIWSALYLALGLKLVQPAAHGSERRRDVRVAGSPWPVGYGLAAEPTAKRAAIAHDPPSSCTAPAGAERFTFGTQIWYFPQPLHFRCRWVFIIWPAQSEWAI